MLLAGRTRLLDQSRSGLLGGRDDALGLGARGIQQGGLLPRCGVAQLLGLGPQRDGVVRRLRAQLLAVGPGGLDLVVARGLGGAHQERCLLVGVDHDGGRLLGRPGEDLLGLLAGPAGLGAVGLGLGREAAGLLAHDREVSGQPVRLCVGLALQLVGHLLGARQQGGRRGFTRRGRGGIERHLPAPFARVPRPTV